MVNYWRKLKGPGLATYWIVIRVNLADSLSVQDAESHGIPPLAIGYYQKFGVTQSSEGEARELVANQISPIGDLDWSESVISKVDPARLEPQILARSSDWSRPGIWYKSGRIFVAPNASSE